MDSSSGIYAYALALGLGCHIVGSTTVDRTLQFQLEVLGASLDLMEPGKDLKLDQDRRVRRVRELLEAAPGTTGCASTTTPCTTRGTERLPTWSTGVWEKVR